jgi:Asp/Glu/hydantoin racemase
MGDAARIVLIHATSVAIAPIAQAAAQVWPEAEAVNLFDESLSIDRARTKALTPALSARIGALTAHAEGMGARGVLFTCSAFGPAIDAAGARARIPVLKPNEAMFDAAFANGNRIALICTFEPAVASMVEEFDAEARRRNRTASIMPLFCEGAFAALHAGDTALHDRLVAETAGRITGVDAILLTQFSMARAAPACRAVTDLPVLTSPETAIARLRAAILQGAAAC